MMFNWKSMVIGKILGDGRIDGSKLNGGSLYVEQSIKQHEYLYDNWDRLTNVGLPANRPVIYRKARSATEPFTYSLGFRVNVCHELDFVLDWIDANGDKVLPDDIYDQLDETALAYWIMDDGQMGSLKPGTNIVAGGLTLCTDNFTHEEVAIQIDVLSRKWGFVVTPNKKGANLRIYFSRASMPALAELVSPYMHPSMMDKIRH